MGTCTAYGGTASLRSTTSPLSALESLPGRPLDAGMNIAVSGAAGERLLPPGGRIHTSYRAIIGGRAPVPGIRELPLFLTPGDFQVSAPGGTDVGAFKVKLSSIAPLVWRNRDQVGEVDRARGATVTWEAPPKSASAMILIVAMNADSQTGALGVATCLAKGDAENFQIPAYALANIPPSPARPRGFPLNLILLLELPEKPAIVSGLSGLDRVQAFATSVSGRTVRFK
jgi:hypothetical protein